MSKICLVLPVFLALSSRRHNTKLGASLCLLGEGLKWVDRVGSGDTMQYYDNGYFKDAFKNSWENH